VWTTFGTKAGWTSLVGDFTRDGRDDIASYHPGSGNWVVSTSTGSSFTNRVWNTYGTKSGWTQHLVSDLNGDGLDDLVSARSQPGIWATRFSTGSSFSASAP
jgi:hypothetical protein